MGLELQLGN